MLSLVQLYLRFTVALVLSPAAAASLCVCIVWPALGLDFNLSLSATR